MRALRIVGGGVALLLVAALALAFSLRPPPPALPPEPGALLSDVVLVQPGEGRRAASLRVEGERIVEIGAPRRGDDDPYAGAFVLPGLTDLHVHFPAFRLPGEIDLSALLFVAHGITTVRVAAEGQAGVATRVRERVDAGELVGPRIFQCGPFVDGEAALWPNSRIVRTPGEARATVEALAADGVDCIKAYDALDADSTDALREAAHARDLRLIGHTPRSVSFDRARLDDVQHLRGVHPPFDGERMQYPFFLAAWRRLDEAWLAHVTEVSLRERIAHTPTLVTIDSLLRSRDWETRAAEPDLALMPAPYRDALWHGEHGLNAAGFMSDADFAMVADALDAMKRTVGHFHRSGVRIHTGTDANAPGVVPGASLHRELELLVDAGLTPEQAIALSTGPSTAYLGVSELGRLQSGAPAELAIFRQDPTRDLAALGSLVGVVRGGRLISRDALDAQLASYREHFHGPVYRHVVTPAARVMVRVLLAQLAGRATAPDAEAP